MKRIFALMLALLLTACMVIPGAAATDRVTTLLKNMSLRDKITQMLMVDFRKWDQGAGAQDFTVMNDQVRQIIEDYNFGAVILFANNIKETEQSFHLTMSMQEAATADGGIPLLISTDQEGGTVYRLGSGTALPGNMALGATADPSYARMAGQIIGSELSVLGINATLAPVVDVNSNPNNPVIGLRSFGDNATAVGQMACAVIEGLKEYNVIGCAKHFPGHGDTSTDSHYGLPKVDKPLEVLLETELLPYEMAISQGIEMIMTAHILYPQLEQDKILSNKTGLAEALPATMSDDILTGLLKEKMGFEGIIVTDAMNMAGISDKWGQVQSVVIALSAGADMICMPCNLSSQNDLKKLDTIIDGVEAAVTDGTIPMSRIDDAVRRILTVKENRGILDWNEANFSLEQAKTVVGGTENREMERRIAAAAVTVVKNEDNTLPLNITQTSKILMLVPYKNEVAQTLLAWNRAGEAGLIPTGAEVDYYIFEKESGISAALKTKLQWADAVIIGSEVSKASRMFSGSWQSALPNAVCAYLRKNGKIAVVASLDKPYDVQDYPDAHAIVAAYGCKGSGIDPTEALVGGATGGSAAYGPNIIAAVEVILGTFGAQGRLSVNIAKLDDGSNTFTDELVYQNGFGIFYDARTHQHTYGSDWSADETHHWHGATCGHDVRSDKALHQPNDTGMCAVCGAPAAPAHTPTTPPVTEAPTEVPATIPTTAAPTEVPSTIPTASPSTAPTPSPDASDSFPVIWIAAAAVSIAALLAIIQKKWFSSFSDL